MATPLFKTHVEQFLRRVGQGNFTITYTGNVPDAITGMTKYTFPQIYDYYQFSGQSLFRAIERYSKGEAMKMFPNFFVTTSVTAGSGEYAVTESIERIIEPITVWTDGATPVKKPAYLIPDGVLELCINSVGIRAISTDYPGFYLRDGKIKILPSTKNRITFSYVKSVPRIQLTDHATTYVDIWPSNYGKLLVDGMVMLAKADSNDTNLEAFYFNQLMNQYKVQSAPITNQNNSLTEQL
jgi:hypothetical protein